MTRCLPILLLVATMALAQPSPLAGGWAGESLCLTLTITGTAVSGTCRDPEAKVAGTVSGQVLPSGRALTAKVTWPADSGLVAYEFGLMLHPKAPLLNGYRWDENTAVPTAIALRRDEPLLISPADPRPPTNPPTTPPPVTAQPVGLFDNSNPGGVRNGPTKPTVFIVARPTRLTYLRTYHYNNGAGVAPGTLGLRGADGKTYGPWPAKGFGKGAGPLPIMWFVEPNLELPAGTYTIVDSQPATWSCNDQSGSVGIAWVSGLPH